MAFRYKLESILRVRQSIERQEEQRLFAIASTVAKLRAEIAKLDENWMAQKREIYEELESGGSGAALQFMAVCDAAIEERRKRLARTLKECEERRLEQLGVHQKARQKREILKGLRDQQQVAYELEFARHLQQDADEAFLFQGLFLQED
jgi:flagellar biosynthesis chaperone FliJ